MANLTVQAPDGKTYTLPWSEQRDPTEAEIDALIAAQNGKPNNTPGQNVPTSDDDSYFGSLLESAKGMGKFLYDVASVGPMSPSGMSPGEKANKAKEIVEGLVSPITGGFQKVKGIADQYVQGQISPVDVITGVGKAAGHTAAGLIGIPSEQIGKDISEGKYKKAAGEATIPVALLAAGAMKPKGAAPKVPVGELHGPIEAPLRGRITDPARMLPSSTGTETPLTAPRSQTFYAGQAGVADPNLGYFSAENGTIIPVDPITAAKYGPEGIAPEQVAPTLGPDIGPMVHDTTNPGGLLPTGEPGPVPPPNYGNLRHGLSQEAPYHPVESLAPDRMRAPSTNQTVWDAILPENITGRSKYAAKASDIPSPKKSPSWFLEAEEVRPNEGVPLSEADLNAVNETRQKIDARRQKMKAEIESKDPSSTKTVAEAVTKASEDIPVEPAKAEQIVRNITKDSWFRDVYDRLFTGVDTQLKKISPQLANLAYKARTEGNQLGGEWASKIKKVSKGLSKEDNLLAYRILDGQAKITDTTPGNVKAAVSKIRAITEEIGEIGEQSGIHIKVGPGESVPFKRMEGEYAPHQYPAEFFKDEGSLIQKLIESGKTAAEAEQIAKNSRLFSERFISPQHAREFNMPGYIEDLGVFEKYAYEMAERVKQAEHFGAMDVSPGADTPINRLIEQSTNPEKARRLATEMLDRGIKADPNIHKAAQFVVNAEVLTHLSLSAINQISDLAGVPVRTGTRNFVSGLYQTLRNYGAAVEGATESGALAIMKKEILKDISQGHWASTSYGLSKMEEVVRTVSSTSGKAAIQDLFGKIKSGKLSTSQLKRARSEFGRLLDGDIDTILKQDKLTQKQINLAAGRTVELVNSIPDKLSLPPAFTYHNPLVRIPLLFKRFAFTTTKNLAQAIQQNPRRVIPALVTYGLLGEVTGDAKAAVMASVHRDMDKVVDAVSKRSDKTPFGDFGNKHVNRAVTNLMQSWFLGLFGDVAEGVSRGWRGTAGLVGGPVASDLYELADVTNQAVRGNFDPAKKSALKRVPFIGAGLAKTEEKKKASSF